MPSALYKNLPECSGIYLMKGSNGCVFYIGKAANLRRRVSSYFERPYDYKIERLLSQVKKIDYQKTDTAIEALILESQLIKKHKPIFNVKEKDDKSFLWVLITKDKFPRFLLSRGKGDFGPFTSSSSIREALRIIRRIFPFSVHPADKIGKFKRPCFEREIGLCPGTCIGLISRLEYLKNIKNIKLFFKGKKKKIIQALIREMNSLSRNLEFEKAEKIKRQIFSLQHIQDVALINDPEIENLKLPPRRNSNEGSSRVEGFALSRIEGYDISNISGTSATGSMVVFSARGGLASGWTDVKPDKNEYRKFKIRTIAKSDDVGMLREVLRRRFYNDWPLPNLILVDGGKPQVNAARSVLEEFGLKIPVIGIAKGSKRKKNEFIGKIPEEVSRNTLIKVRNEAHRFAVSYHKKLRSYKLFKGIKS